MGKTARYIILHLVWGDSLQLYGTTFAIVTRMKHNHTSGVYRPALGERFPECMALEKERRILGKLWRRQRLWRINMGRLLWQLAIPCCRWRSSSLQPQQYVQQQKQQQVLIHLARILGFPIFVIPCPLATATRNKLCTHRADAGAEVGTQPKYRITYALDIR